MSRHDPPGWVRPEQLPWDLPPHEQWATPGWEVWGAPSKHPPQTAPGFTRAARLGLLPAPPPPEPPVPLPGRSAAQLGLLGLGVFLSPVLVLPLVGTRLGVVGIVYGLASFVGSLRLLGAHLRREEDEAAAGYTTLWGAPGLWRLSRDGRPLRPPDRSLLPAGFYPSPYWPGVLQKWEGTHWKPLPHRWWRRPEQWFRTPKVNYLDPWR